jgi:hypothetical protein
MYAQALSTGIAVKSETTSKETIASSSEYIVYRVKVVHGAI